MNEIIISQENYVLYILKYASMLDCKQVNNPMNPNQTEIATHLPYNCKAEYFVCSRSDKSIHAIFLVRIIETQQFKFGGTLKET